MRLDMTEAEVALLTRPQREERVRLLVADSHRRLHSAIEEHVLLPGYRIAGIVGLFSGGNDSTTMMHIFRDVFTHAAHANTGIGIEATRQYVRDVCAAWHIPLIEKMAPRWQDRYRTIVLEEGFPGPAKHWKMYQRLKERALRAVRAVLVHNPRRERVVFVAGRRRQESKRRADVPENERIGSTVWVSPLILWTKLDMNTYRLMVKDVPTNQVAAIMHMSCECLCGAFAAPGEREELEAWFGTDAALVFIREMEELIKDRDDIPSYRKIWGWGAFPELKRQSDRRERTPSRSGPLCDACDSKLAYLEEETL